MEHKVSDNAGSVVTYNPKVRIRNSDSILSSSLALLDVQSVRRFLPPRPHPSLPKASVATHRQYSQTDLHLVTPGHQKCI